MWRHPASQCASPGRGSTLCWIPSHGTPTLRTWRLIDFNFLKLNNIGACRASSTQTSATAHQVVPIITDSTGGDRAAGGRVGPLPDVVVNVGNIIGASATRYSGTGGAGNTTPRHILARQASLHAPSHLACVGPTPAGHINLGGVGSGAGGTGPADYASAILLVLPHGAVINTGSGGAVGVVGGIGNVVRAGHQPSAGLARPRGGGGGAHILIPSSTDRLGGSYTVLSGEDWSCEIQTKGDCSTGGAGPRGSGAVP